MRYVSNAAFVDLDVYLYSFFPYLAGTAGFTSCVSTSPSLNTHTAYMIFYSTEGWDPVTGQFKFSSRVPSR